MLGQLAVADKSNEITAMRCQRQVAQPVVTQSALKNVLALKGNQGTLYDGVKLYLEDLATPVFEAVQTNSGHGWVETRMTSVSANVAWLEELHHWPGLQAIGKVTACRHERERASRETRYYLMSKAFLPEWFNEIVPSNCSIENDLHWRLGVVFN